jgi:hypothetical protein
MDYELLIRSEARTDLLDAFYWYQEQRAGLGLDFKLCVDEALSKLKNNHPFIKKFIMIFDEFLLKGFHSAFFT